jgi:hypothetical protein
LDDLKKASENNPVPAVPGTNQVPADSTQVSNGQYEGRLIWFSAALFALHLPRFDMYAARKNSSHSSCIKNQQKNSSIADHISCSRLLISCSAFKISAEANLFEVSVSIDDFWCKQKQIDMKRMNSMMALLAVLVMMLAASCSKDNSVRLLLPQQPPPQQRLT